MASQNAATLETNGLLSEEEAIVANVSKAVGIQNPQWLVAVMDHESNLKTTSVNPYSGATGLIQFLGSTACSLLGIAPTGKTKKGYPYWSKELKTQALARVKAMSFGEQMQLVQKYLTGWKGRYNTGLDVAMAVFYPSALGDYGYVIAKKGQDAYEQNKALDKDGKGFIVPTDYARSLFKFGLRHGVSMSPVDDYLTTTAAAKTLQQLFDLINRIMKENPKQPVETWKRIQTGIKKDIDKLGASHSTIIKLDGFDLDYRKTLEKQIRAAFSVQSTYTVSSYVMNNPLEAAKGLIQTTSDTLESGVNVVSDLASSPGKLALLAGAGVAGLYFLRRLF